MHKVLWRMLRLQSSWRLQVSPLHIFAWWVTLPSALSFLATASLHCPSLQQLLYTVLPCNSSSAAFTMAPMHFTGVAVSADQLSPGCFTAQQPQRCFHHGACALHRSKSSLLISLSKVTVKLAAAQTWQTRWHLRGHASCTGCLQWQHFHT